MGYVRIRRRGMKKVTAEIMIMCLAFNIRKLFSVHNKNDYEGIYRKRKDDTTQQVFPEVKPKKKG